MTDLPSIPHHTWDIPTERLDDITAACSAEAARERAVAESLWTSGHIDAATYRAKLDHAWLMDGAATCAASERLRRFQKPEWQGKASADRNQAGQRQKG
jgi:hypothetical protein